MNEIDDVVCCSDCGGVAGGGASLKACTACKLAKYCNVKCQKNHWPKHKKLCKQRAAELHDEALFKEPPPKKNCPICFLPMPTKLISCVSLPPATISSLPIYDFAIANVELASKSTETYYSCCGKSICGGCAHSFTMSGNNERCPFCNSDVICKTDGEQVEALMKRVEANDAGAIYAIGNDYYHGGRVLLQDRVKAMELWKQSAELGYSQAHFQLGVYYCEGGEMKKAKFNYEAAAMAGHEAARHNLGCTEGNSGNVERALKHWMIAASCGEYNAMNNLLVVFKQGLVSRDDIESTLTSYNTSCVEMRSEARDRYINNVF